MAASQLLRLVVVHQVIAYDTQVPAAKSRVWLCWGGGRACWAKTGPPAPRGCGGQLEDWSSGLATQSGGSREAADSWKQPHGCCQSCLQLPAGVAVDHDEPRLVLALVPHLETEGSSLCAGFPTEGGWPGTKGGAWHCDDSSRGKIRKYRLAGACWGFNWTRASSTSVPGASSRTPGRQTAWGRDWKRRRYSRQRHWHWLLKGRRSGITWGDGHNQQPDEVNFETLVKHESKQVEANKSTWPGSR